MPAPPPLWSDAFLETEIREQPEYQALLEDSAEFDAFVEAARRIVGEVRAISSPDEQLTIERAITPLLAALGWPTPLPKRSLTSRDEIDLALYADEAQRELSLGTSEREQVLSADGIVECKEWGRSLDGSGSGARPGETAAQQLQRYLLIAGTDSAEALRWGILTNGARWRIYSYRARPRDRTWEIDLEQLLISRTLFDEEPQTDKLHELRVAWLLFRRQSWIPVDGELDSFLDRLLEAGRRRDAKVADDLSDVIFNHVYPDLVRLFWDKQPDAEPDVVARAALTFLYRLLFIYYAEDRGMLDTENPGYRPHSLRHSVRDPIAELGEAASHSTVSTQYWQRLKTLRAIIDLGDPAIDQPPYDGGLFAAGHAVLDEIELSDAELAPIIRQLSHTADGTYVSYRSLEVRQLGSIYERLLERVPQRDDDGDVEVVISPYARKDSGSYYTPQELVDLIVEQTLTPLVEERIAAFRNEPSEANDPAAALLELKILDPAMGSGHFLITALDWLTDQLAALVNREWDEAEPGYISPIRAQLWELQEEHPGLGDETLLQRMTLKRCLYGVDKNPLAVELAKVALWLHTFAPPLPLPHIEHRIRAGDSLLGVAIDTVADYLAAWGPDYIARGVPYDCAQLLRATEESEQTLTDSVDLVIDDVRDSRRHHRNVMRNSEDLRRAFNLIAGFRWLSTGMKKREREEFHAPLTEALSGHVSRADAILHNGENDEGLTQSTPEFQVIRERAKAVVTRENIFHWDIEFPHVMADGGFDAIITNPPWDRIKLQEVEWWAARKEEIAKAPTAAARKRMIAALRAAGDPLVAEYDSAVERATQLSAVCRKSGDYPLLGKGDINIYSLFVERALSLLNDDGIAGILTPSGIYADKTAAEFFRSITMGGRLAGVYDFENRRSDDPEAGTGKWFADVHLGYKFCALIFGGEARSFPATRCGFFLRGKADLDSSERVFSFLPDDFARINPNTHTAPIFRTRRDAEIVSRIYREHPVFVRHVNGEEQKLWPIRYHTMFHMSMDSALFQTREELDGIGAYPVEWGRYRRGGDDWLPLYQGRMIDQFDHRANSVGYNAANVRRKYTSIPTSDAQRQNAAFTPLAQYWVPMAATNRSYRTTHGWLIAYRRSTKEDNARGMVAAIGPAVAYGDSAFLLMPDELLIGEDACLIVGNLNAVPFDFVVRRKIHGVNLSKYIIEQLPMIAPADYDRKFGETTARDLVRDHALRLSYTAHDLAPFARDLGYEGEPYIWDPAKRRQLRARLDALYFHLYGLDEDDTAYILNQFTVLEKNERKEHDRYLTKELVIGHYRALAAGDTTAEIRLEPLGG